MSAPTETELQRCVREERALVQPYAHATTARKIMAIAKEMDTARAATDEAMRKVELALEAAEAAIRDAITLEDGLNAYDAQGALDMIADARTTTAPIAQVEP